MIFKMIELLYDYLGLYIYIFGSIYLLVFSCISAFFLFLFFGGKMPSPERVRFQKVLIGALETLQSGATMLGLLGTMTNLANGFSQIQMGDPSVLEHVFLSLGRSIGTTVAGLVCALIIEGFLFVVRHFIPASPARKPVVAEAPSEANNEKSLATPLNNQSRSKKVAMGISEGVALPSRKRKRWYHQMIS